MDYRKLKGRPAKPVFFYVQLRSGCFYGIVFSEGFKNALWQMTTIAGTTPGMKMRVASRARRAAPPGRRKQRKPAGKAVVAPIALRTATSTKEARADRIRKAAENNPGRWSGLFF
jgi:hypothetical protein